MRDALTISNVTKRFGSFVAVDDFSLRVPAGQVLGFLGPNGAGKTTTIRMIMSIIYPDAGQISVLGHQRAIDIKDRIGYLPEERGLYPKMTVERTLRYFGRLKELRGRELHERIAAALERVGLSEWLKKPTEALSKGMQQKIQFVATILHEPELVILDEPFAGLDPINIELLKDLMFGLRDRGATVIFSTHQMEQAQRLCDRIVLINRGRKLIEGGIDEIRSRFATRIVTFDGDGDLAAVARSPGVLNSQISAGHARIEIEEGVDPHELVRRALESARISKFEVQRPDLHEIFVKLVGADGRRPATDTDPAAPVGEGARHD